MLLDHIILLLQISVVQRMKANHNYLEVYPIDAQVVANISCSKNESKSQQEHVINKHLLRCCKYQLFKEWKQITTVLLSVTYRGRLLQISVVQRMKANHNDIDTHLHCFWVVANISCSKNESKSQLRATWCQISQGCCKYQLFKEWKQITTVAVMLLKAAMLLQISVVQRMKANHNYASG